MQVLIGAALMLIWQVFVTPWVARLPPQSKVAMIVRFLHGVWLAVEAQKKSGDPGYRFEKPKPADVKKALLGGLVVLLLTGCVRTGKNPCTAYSEREYWFGGGAKFSGALALAASGTAIPVQGDKERTVLAVGAATTGATSLALMWLADGASASFDEQCRKEPVK